MGKNEMIRNKNGGRMAVGVGWGVSHSVFQYLWEQPEQRGER